MKIWILGFGFSLFCLTAGAQFTATGHIVNARTNEQLPFVNVSIAGTNSGTTSDVEGKFILHWSGTSVDIVFTFVGYEPLTQHLTPADKSILIKLTEKTTELNEVVVYPGENPAFRILRKAIAAKPFNDPENLKSFSYNSYNKLYMSLDGKSDSAKNEKEKQIQKFAENNHVFVSESFTERKFVKPNLTKETVLGNKMSGIRDPFFAFMATDFQPFSFYRDYIPLLDIKYLNPLSAGSEDRYDYTVTDTVYHAPDSVFIIAFEPLPGKSFQGLKGQLYISSDGFALEHVLAQTADPHALIEFYIQQKYAKVDGHWFPVQLNSELRFKEFSLAGKQPRYVQRSYLNDIHIGQFIPKKEFGLLNVEFDPNANFRKDDFWVAHRPDTLEKKELRTYKFYDSLGPRMNKLNTNMKILESIVVGKFRAGKFYFPLDDIARFNRYEKVRLGLGIETGERISRRFTFDGYAAWGFKDKALKYGGGAQLNFIRHRDGYLRFGYKQDIGEPGASDFIQRPIGALNQETIRSWRAFRMDSIRLLKVELGLRPIRFSQVAFFFQQQRRNPTYEYSFITEKDALGLQQSFTAVEAGIKWRFAFNEHYTQVGNNKIVSNNVYPRINIYASHGFSGVWNGGFEFSKVEVRLDEQWTVRGLGTTTIQLNGGAISGKVPYPFLFNGKGSNFHGSIFNSLLISNYFQTMGFYEFASDRFAYFFLNHNFGRLTGTKHTIFRPELEVVHNMGIGSLSNKSDHKGVAFSTMEKGYLESGMILNNIIRFKYVKLFYFGLGVGGFYRYGNYALPREADNFAFKMIVTATF